MNFYKMVQLIIDAFLKEINRLIILQPILNSLNSSETIFIVMIMVKNMKIS